MKANEAPEKIYVEITHPISDEYTEMIAFEDSNGVEYTRTDAFIRKACSWLEENWTSFVNYDDEDGVVYYLNLTDKFKKFMKGE